MSSKKKLHEYPPDKREDILEIFRKINKENKEGKEKTEKKPLVVEIKQGLSFKLTYE